VELGANTAAVFAPKHLSKRRQRMLVAAGAAAGAAAESYYIVLQFYIANSSQASETCIGWIWTHGTQDVMQQTTQLVQHILMCLEKLQWISYSRGAACRKGTSGSSGQHMALGGCFACW
jgi:hypothetical protein